MKKTIVYFLSFVLFFNLVLFSTINVASAQDNSQKQEEFKKNVDPLSLSNIKSYFEGKISEKESEKSKADITVDQKNSIDEEINTYSEILSNIQAKKITEESVKNAKIKLRIRPKRHLQMIHRFK